MEIKGKSVLITGAARRLGKAIALALAGRGAQVVIHYNRSKKEAEKVVEEIEKKGGAARLASGDISKAKECEKIVRDAVKAFGRLDVLVNNAAVFFKTPLFQVTEKEWNEILDANLKGSFFCAQAAAKEMRKNGGKIINIADWSAVRPYEDYLPYCASKAGVIALTKGLARSLAPKVTVNAIAPGPILLPDDFDEAEKEAIIRQTPLKRIGAPDDVVNAVLFLLEGTDFMTGTTIMIDGGRLIA
ncbi:MAG TPA: SDR family oxidoreductase [Candidatus Manganitrophaceae bacterium]|nr:SDR family oxidoreductase [Candidatus Manganitrophaceae bacterium]